MISCTGVTLIGHLSTGRVILCIGVVGDITSSNLFDVMGLGMCSLSRGSLWKNHITLSCSMFLSFLNS